MCWQQQKSVDVQIAEGAGGWGKSGYGIMWGRTNQLLQVLT